MGEINIKGIDDGVSALFADTAHQAQLLNNRITELAKAMALFNDSGQAIKTVLSGLNAEGQVVTSTVKVLKDATTKMTVSVTEHSAAIKKQVEALAAQEAAQKSVDRQFRESEKVRKTIQRSYSLQELGRLQASPTEIINLKKAESDLIQLVKTTDLSAGQVQRALSNIRAGFTHAYENKHLITSLANLDAAQRKVGANAYAATTKVGSATKAVTKETQDLLLSWESMGRIVAVQLLRRALFALTAALRESIKEAIEFSKRVAEIQTISQNAQLSIVEWTRGLRNLSESFGLKILDTTEAAYQTLSNQIAEGAESFAFMNTVAKFSITTLTSMTDSANLLSAVLNAFGKDVSETEDVAAKLFKTIELGRIRGTELGSTIGRVAILAHQLGISFEELDTFLTVVTIRGVKVSEAMTQMRGVFTKLLKPTEDMKKLFSELGVANAEELIQTRSLSEFFNILKTRTSGLSSELSKLFPVIRGISGAMVGVATSSGEWDSALAEINKASVTFAKAQEIILTSTGKIIEIELTKIKNFFTLSFGQSTLEILAGINAVATLSGIIKTASTVLAGLLLPAIVKITVAMIKLIAITPFGVWLTAIGLAVGALARTYFYWQEEHLAAQAAMQKAVEDRAKKTIDIEFKTTQKLIENIKAYSKVENKVSSDIIGNWNMAANEQAKIIKNLNKIIKDEFSKTDDVLKDSLRNLRTQQQDTVKSFEDLAKYRADMADTVNDQIFELSLEKLENINDKLLLFQSGIQDAEQRIAAAFMVGDSALFQTASDDLRKLILDRSKLAQKTKEEEKKLAEEITQKKADLLLEVAKLEEQKRLESGASRLRQAIKLDIRERNLIIKKERDIEQLRKKLADIRSSDVDKYANNFEQQLREVQMNLNTFIEGLQASQLKDAIQNAQKESNYRALLKTQEVEQEKYVRFDPKTIVEAGTPELLQQIFDERLQNINTLINSTKELNEIQTSTVLQEHLANLESAKADTILLQNTMIYAKKLALAKQTRVAATEELLALAKEAEARRKIILTQQASLKVAATGINLTELKNVISTIDKFNRIQEYESFGGALIRDQQLTVKQVANLTTVFESLQQFQTGGAVKNLEAFSAATVALAEDSKLLSGLGLKSFVENTAKLGAVLEEIAKTATRPLAIEMRDIEKTQQAIIPEAKLYTGELQKANEEAAKHVTLLQQMEAIRQRIHEARLIESLAQPGAFARGGHISSSDTIPSLLSPGEFVVNAKSARRFYSQLVGINSGMARGGSNTSHTTVGDIHISMSPTVSAAQNVINFAKQVRRQVRRGTVKLS